MTTEREVIIHCQKQLKKDPPADKILHYLRRLSRLQITIEDLRITGVGKTVNQLSRLDGEVGAYAGRVVEMWKSMVEAQGAAEARRQQEAEARAREEDDDDDEGDENSDGNDEDDDDEEDEDDDDDEEEDNKEKEDRAPVATRPVPPKEESEHSDLEIDEDYRPQASPSESRIICHRDDEDDPVDDEPDEEEREIETNLRQRVEPALQESEEEEDDEDEDNDGEDDDEDSDREECSPPAKKPDNNRVDHRKSEEPRATSSSNVGQLLPDRNNWSLSSWQQNHVKRPSQQETEKSRKSSPTRMVKHEHVEQNGRHHNRDRDKAGPSSCHSSSKGDQHRNHSSKSHRSSHEKEKDRDKSERQDKDAHKDKHKEKQKDRNHKDKDHHQKEKDHPYKEKEHQHKDKEHQHKEKDHQHKEKEHQHKEKDHQHREKDHHRHKEKEKSHHEKSASSGNSSSSSKHHQKQRPEENAPSTSAAIATASSVSSKSHHKDKKRDKEREQTHRKEADENRHHKSSSSKHSDKQDKHGKSHHQPDKSRHDGESSKKSSSETSKTNSKKEERSSKADSTTSRESPSKGSSSSSSSHKRKKPEDSSSKDEDKTHKKLKLIHQIGNTEIDSTSGLNFSDVLGCLDKKSAPATTKPKKSTASTSSPSPPKLHRKNGSIIPPPPTTSKTDKSSLGGERAASSSSVSSSASPKKSSKSEKKSQPTSYAPPVSTFQPPKPTQHLTYQMEIELNDNKPFRTRYEESLLSGNDKSTSEGLDALSSMMSSRKDRTKVYSGHKTGFVGKVPSLFEMCIRVIQDNLDCLGYTGGVPYDILKPALKGATVKQLENIEFYNSYLQEYTDELWKYHCQRDCKGEIPREMESWKELYYRCQDNRQAKLQQFALKSKKRAELATPVRKAKLAYVEPGLRGTKFNKSKAATIKNGMKSLKHREEKGPKGGGPSYSANAGGKNQNNVTFEEASVIIPSDSKASAAPAPSRERESTSSAPKKPKKAPLMQKTMKFIKSMYRR